MKHDDEENSRPSITEDTFGLVGTRLDGKYDVESVVAEGGFGVVYRAQHRSLQKTVAVKVLKIPPELPNATRAEFLAKFAQEARTIAKLEHPAIVRVLDFGACPMPKGEAAPWMALEWLTGTTLEDDLHARGTSPRRPSEVLALLGPVLDGVALAHEEGVAHRDIKPANVMLVRDRRGELTTKLLDFGIAKLMGNEDRSSTGLTATKSTLHAFSLHAAAPEQISGTRTGPWTDVHALALLVSEMVTACAPYAGNDATELYAAVLSTERPTPRKHGFDAGAWEPVLAKALALKPAERFQGARELWEALRAEVPAVVERRVAGPLLLESRPRESTDITTTLRPAARRTEPAAPSASRPWMLPAAIALAGVVVVVAYGSGVRRAPVARVATQDTRPSPEVALTPTPTVRNTPSTLPSERATEIAQTPASPDGGVVRPNATPRPMRASVAARPAGGRVPARPASATRAVPGASPPTTSGVQSPREILVE